jgi:cytochrome c oxidase subunit I
VALEFVAFLLGGINFVTTAMNSRAPGHEACTTSRSCVWMIVIASILFMASVGPLIAGAVMLLFDQTSAPASSTPARRRPDPLAAPVLVLRAPRGLRGAAARDRHRGRDHHGLRPQEAVRLQDRALHGGRHRRAELHVWAHHQFIAGIDPRMANVFTITTLLISVPIAEMMFVYIATLYGGSINFTTPMLWALSFIASS